MTDKYPNCQICNNPTFDWTEFLMNSLKDKINNVEKDFKKFAKSLCTLHLKQLANQMDIATNNGDPKSKLDLAFRLVTMEDEKQ